MESENVIVRLQSTKKWCWNSDGEVKSAHCGVCGQECVGAGFNSRFFALHVWLDGCKAVEIVSMCDPCEQRNAPNIGCKIILDDSPGFIDAVFREND